MENTKLKGNRGFKIKNEISVVCAGDCNFIKPIQVMIKSIEVNTSAPVNVYILQKGWNMEEKKETIRKFSEEKIKIHFIQMNRDIPEEQLKVSATISIEAYYRLFLDKLLPETLEQVIYLDGDLIVEGDIKELWGIPMDGKALMAATEMFHEAYYVSSPLALRTWKKMGIPEKQKYFNSGVLKVNLKKWRQEKIGEKIIQYLTENKEDVLWHDQDGLNAVLWNDRKELPAEWNVMTALFYETDYSRINITEKEAKMWMEHPKILHYANSKEKPWKETCRHPRKDRYFIYEIML